MKILILNWRDVSNPSAGGAEILTHEMAKRWVKWGHKVTQFSSEFPNCLRNEEIDGVKIIRRGKPDTRSLFSSVHFLAFWNYIAIFKGKYDFVIDEVHGIPFFTPWYVKEKKVVLICEVAANLWFEMLGFFFGSLGRLIEKFYLKFVYKNVYFITISDSVKNDLISNGVLESKISVLKMGITTSQLKGKVKKEKNPTFIFVGRISRAKGLEDIIIAFSQVKHKLPSSKLWIVGQGDNGYLLNLKKKISEVNLGQDIKFFGFVPETKKYELLGRSWVLLHPSLREGWGLNIIEANSVGTPAIGYNVSGLQDSIQHMKTGMLTTVNSSEGLENAMYQLILNKKQLALFSKNALARASQFNWDTTAKECLDLLKKHG